MHHQPLRPPAFLLIGQAEPELSVGWLEVPADLSTDALESQGHWVTEPLWALAAVVRGWLG